MPRQVPFTANIRITPFEGKRFEYIRSMQTIADNVYTELNKDPELQLAQPGGSQNRSNMLGSASAVKPQIGQSPAQLSITGFLVVDAKNVRSVEEVGVISGGKFSEGQSGNNHWVSNPVASVDDYCKLLKTKLSVAVVAVTSVDWDIFSIDVMNVRYGDRGLHFPR